MAGLYLHIPFCKQACSYCDFYFVTRQDLMPAFVNGLIREIQQTGERQLVSAPIQTIYFGGGTPSLLQIDHLEQILRALDDTFNLAPDEITIEMNPDDAELSRLRAWKQLGINRVSMGIQSFDDELLRTMHRAHTRQEALDALDMLEKTGFDRFTADLIYGNPGQTLAMLDTDLDQMLAFTPPHLSAYALMIEQGTRLGKQVELGRVTVPDDEQVATHFQRVQERLGEAGYTQYEVSNFAQPGCEAIHNTNYWRHVEYLGFGPSAHSFLWPSSPGASSLEPSSPGTSSPGTSSLKPSPLEPSSHRFSEHRSGGLSRVDTRAATAPTHPTGDAAPRRVAVRWQNIRDLTTYLSAESPKERVESEEWLSLAELAEERITLGLRMRGGVDVCLLEEQYHYTFEERQRDWISLQSSVGTFEWNTSTNKLRLTEEGLSLADHLTAKLLSLQ